MSASDAARGDSLGRRVLLRPVNRKQGTINLVSPGVPDEWTSVLTPPALPPGPITVVDLPWSGAAGLRKARQRVAVIPTGNYFGELIIDGPLAALIGDLDGVTRRHVTLADKKGVFAEGYVLYDVTARMPLHRSTCNADFPGGRLAELRRCDWPARLHMPPMFRLLERPGHLFVERALAERIVAAAPGQVVVDEYDPWLDPLPPPYALQKMKPLPDGAAAEEAFWELLATPRATQSAATRTKALSHPFWALAVARCLDGASDEETRRAACLDPLCASIYAKEVDRGPHPITRAAASESGVAALHYATWVDVAIDPGWSERICAEAGHNASSLASFAESLAPIAAFLGRAPGSRASSREAPRPAVQRRDWPAHGRARYATSAKARKRPTHVEPDAALKSDIDAFLERGLARLGLPAEAAPEEVVAAVHAFVDRVRAGDVKLTGKKHKTELQMEVGCAWGEQLHRAFGWQWAKVETDEGEGIALIPDDCAVAHYPFAFLGDRLARKSSPNTTLLLFNMLADGAAPASKKGSYTSVA